MTAQPLTPEREHEIRTFDLHDLIRYGDADYTASATISKILLELLREVDRLRTQVDELGSTADWLLDALRVVHEALSIPHAATVGGDETRQKVLDERVMHTVVTLDVLLGQRPYDRQSALSYLRKRLSEHPPVGYVTSAQASTTPTDGGQ